MMDTSAPIVVPVIYEGSGTACSICSDEFVQGDRVCRLSCRHVFHTQCWERAQRHNNTPSSTPTGPLTCPNCRGAPTIIAIWNYIDADLITQNVGGHIAPSLLETPNTQRFDVTASGMVTPPTPRSADYEGYEIGGGVGNHEAASSHSDHRGRRTDDDDDEIMEELRRAEALDMAFPGLAPRSYSSSYPSFVAHAQTRLADGRHSVIVDPGSVGDLCGDKWAKDIATAAVRAGEKPEHE